MNEYKSAASMNTAMIGTPGSNSIEAQLDRLESLIQLAHERVQELEDHYALAMLPSSPTETLAKDPGTPMQSLITEQLRELASSMGSLNKRLADISSRCDL